MIKLRVNLPKRSTIEKNKEYLDNIQSIIKDYIDENGSKLDDGTLIYLKDLLINKGISIDVIANVPKSTLVFLLVDINMIVIVILNKPNDNSLEVTLKLRELTIK